MTNNNKLEEISWVEGKFLDSKGNEVKPEPRGTPKLIFLAHNTDGVEKEINSLASNSNDAEINAFLKGQENYQEGEGLPSLRTKFFRYPIQFYKI
jgi:hypothetical protein